MAAAILLCPMRGAGTPLLRFVSMLIHSLPIHASRIPSLLLAISLGAALPAAAHAATATNPDALWGIIQRDCLGAAAPRFPCLRVEAGADRRDVVVKDSHGDYQYLLMPLDRVTGIESELLFRAGTPNFFAAAWDARYLTEEALGRRLPRDVASLALNSPHGRSQDQLHIHIDCLRADVHGQLQAWRGRIGQQWQPLPGTLRGHSYLAVFLPGPELTAHPVRTLAASLDDPREVGDWSLLLTGSSDANGRPGFLLLATKHAPDAGNQASAEELQDHACAVVTGATRALEGVR